MTATSWDDIPELTSPHGLASCMDDLVTTWAELCNQSLVFTVDGHAVPCRPQDPVELVPFPTMLRELACRLLVEADRL